MLRRKISFLLDSEEAVTSVEYAIMLAVIVAVVIKAVAVIGTTSEGIFTATAEALQ